MKYENISNAYKISLPVRLKNLVHPQITDNYNCTLQNLRVIKLSRMKWTGHTARKGKLAVQFVRKIHRKVII